MNKIYLAKKNVNLFCFAISDTLTKTMCNLCRNTDNQKTIRKSSELLDGL